MVSHTQVLQDYLTTPRAKATGIPRRDFRTSDKSDS
ncbi:hypothetical protein SPLC1_S300350 [Arthrospira platensis C1]|nr:hypothetical protein SPLC1_S300350 [Arthrospira platensis C1]